MKKVGIKMIKRHVGGYRYAKCPECKAEFEIEKPTQLNLPYCGGCGKYVADADHKFCGFCGCKFVRGE